MLCEWWNEKRSEDVGKVNFPSYGTVKQNKKSTACRSCIPSSPAGPSWDSQGRGNHQCTQSCGTTRYSGCDSDESDVSPARNRRFTFAVQSSGPSAVPERSSLCSAEPSWEKNISAITFKLISYLFWWHFQGLINILSLSWEKPLRECEQTCFFSCFQHFFFFPLLHLRALWKTFTSALTNLAWSVSSAKVFMASTTRGSAVKGQKLVHQMSDSVSCRRYLQ